MKIEIDIDEKCIPDGYSMIGFRKTRNGDAFMDGNGHVLVEGDAGCANGPRPILKKRIAFPSSVKLGSFWICKDAFGAVFVSNKKPQSCGNGSWSGLNCWLLNTDLLEAIMGCALPDPFEGEACVQSCLAYWDADKGELIYYREGEW